MAAAAVGGTNWLRLVGEGGPRLDVDTELSMSGALDEAESVCRCIFGLDPCLGGEAGYSYCS